MTRITKMSELIALAAGLEFETDYDKVALRIVDTDCDGYDLPVGSIAPNSYRWDDGNHTDDELNGTSAMDLDWLWTRKSGDQYFGGYCGRRIWVLGSYYAEGGEDAGEIVMKDAEILQVIDI
jgi:hypothetical protein